MPEPVEPELFQDAMRALTGAVTIITAGRGEDIAGLTATAVCSFSMEPPRLLVSINRSGATFAALLGSGAFCVNILSADQQDLAAEFAGRTGKSGAAKFDPAAWDRSDEMAPRHRRALAAVRCRVHTMTMLGTHAVVIGDVVQSRIGPPSAALVYRDQRFLSV